MSKNKHKKLITFLYGLPGSGKSHVAKIIKVHTILQTIFTIRLWVCVHVIFLAANYRSKPTYGVLPIVLLNTKILISQVKNFLKINVTLINAVTNSLAVNFGNGLKINSSNLVKLLYFVVE